MKFSVFITLYLFTCFFVSAQKGNYQIAFYNVENLFDTIDDPQTDDSEFLPNAKAQWTSDRYMVKLENLCKVILAIGNSKGPDVIGLCEVENEKVLTDLVSMLLAQKQHYGLVHYESADPRGIDVALLYKTEKFTLLSSHFIRFELPNAEWKRTRDILHVKGQLPNKEIIHFYVNHFPSRREGTAESRYKRQFVASQLRNSVDSVLKTNASANIVIMGDFNDEPMDSSMNIFLGAKSITDQSAKTNLYNCMTVLKERGQGTYNYKKEWSLLDQLIVSGAMLPVKGKVSYVLGSATIYKQEWMLEQKEKYKGQPLRTYVGSKYLGGYSDHLPVYILLKLGK
jgi:predicted extracellular nuclease